MTIRSRAILGFLLVQQLFSAHRLLAQVRLPRLVSDSMVLQRDRPIAIWGWASPQEEVTVEFNNRKYTTRADASKRWRLSLPPMKAGGPYTMQIQASNQIILKDILIGDVWLCSGQSNMEMAMDHLEEKYADVIAHCENSNIRQFTVSTKKYSFTPLDDVEGRWISADAQSVLRFSATAYFFARSLYQKYKIPVGLIHSSWGSTPIEAWISEEGLHHFPDYVATANSYKDPQLVQSVLQKNNKNSASWFREAKLKDEGLAVGLQPWTHTAIDTTWGRMKIPGYWEDQGKTGLHGVVWFKKEINLSSADTGRDGLLELGTINDIDTTYFNGVQVGTNQSSYSARRYAVPASIIKAGANTITVRIVSKAGKGGFVPGKIYCLRTAGSTIELAGEWKYKIGVSMPAMPAITALWNQPASMFNGMIAPLIPYTLKGVVWYQGESNTGRPLEYGMLLKDMIDDWRARWGVHDLPFLIVQLPNYMPPPREPAASNWSLLRESQAKVASSLPACGLAVTIDAGEANDIHPLNKSIVGERLSLVARKVAYDEKQLVYSGPIYEAMRVDGNKIILSFSEIGSGLIAKYGDTLRQFAIAGEDKKFLWAHARIEGNTVVVWREGVSRPVAVRYAWADNPESCNLYNKEGLPARPFRTDNLDQSGQMAALIDKNISVAAAQYKYLMSLVPRGFFSRTIEGRTGKLKTTGSGDWVSGFYPGTLLQLYAESKDSVLLKEAQARLVSLEREQYNKSTHDLGFMMYCSFGQAYRLTGNAHYREVLIKSARSLLTRFNPKVGCIKSWNWSDSSDYPVCIDNMMNLELLFWASKATGDSSFCRAAVSHADKTLNNHFRSDHSSYHIVVYDPLTGTIKRKQTGQGFANESAWARGQAWGLYGFTMLYRETGDKKYLQQARYIAEFILANPNLPSDKVPYWDYNDPSIPHSLRDASSAAIVASALVELSTYEPLSKNAGKYLETAEKMIQSLSSDGYMALPWTNEGFLLKHSVGSMVNKEEIDKPVTYADYYFIEAMRRYKQLNKTSQ